MEDFNFQSIKYLLIDDERDIRADVVCRRPVDGLKALVHMGPFDVLYLDHDMGLDAYMESPLSAKRYESSGYGIACFLEEHPEFLPESVEIVSSSPVGIKRIAQALSNVYPFKSLSGRTFSKHKLDDKTNFFS